VTALDRSWDSGKLKKGESFQLEITSDISVEYDCIYHPKMKADFVVRSP